MDQYEVVRTAHRVYGKNISELSRMTGHSRNTIKKAIRGEPWDYKKQHHQPFPAIGPYIEISNRWLERDKAQPKKQRHTARRIYYRLVEEHDYKGGESTVRRYVKVARIDLGLDTPQAFIPFVRFYPCECQQAFFDAHIHAVQFFGGVFPVGLIYDNLTTAMRKVLRGKNRIEQESYSKFKAYYSFESR